MGGFWPGIAVLAMLTSLTQPVMGAQAGVTVAPAPVTASKPRGRLPKLLREVEKKYADAGSMTANLTQIDEIAATHQKKTTSGTIKAKQPDKVRWETLKPEKNLLVTDGKTFWFYTPPFDEGDRGQVIEKKASQVQSQLASALISGRFTDSKMRITTLSASRFEVKPNRGTAGTVARAEIQVDPEKQIIDKVILEHKGGNRSEITLSNVELGKRLTDDTFVFKAPANTDHVSE